MTHESEFSASVVIIVKDEPSIACSLAILRQQCETIGAECIVVDASDDRLHRIASEFPWVHWIDYKQPSNRRITLAHQRNIGVRAANSCNIVFCDAGGEPAQD